MRKTILLNFLQHAEKRARLSRRNFRTASCLKSKNDTVRSAKLYDHTATALLKEPKECVLKWLDSFDAVISDCDGVLWLNKTIIDGSVDAFNRFKQLGKKGYFCTNNSTNSREEILQKAQDMGFEITLNEIMTAAHATAVHLKNLCFTEKVYVIGKRGLIEELDAVGIKHTGIGPDIMPEILGDCLAQYFKAEEGIGAVLIAFDEHFSFPKMIRAATYLKSPNCLFLATNADEVSPLKDVVLPSTGCLMSAIETCSDRKALVIGKPNPEICEKLIREKEIVPERTLMIGDRCNTDVLLGYNCGFQTLLVGSGIHGLDYVERLKNSKDPESRKLIPDSYLPKLGDILELLRAR